MLHNSNSEKIGVGQFSGLVISEYHHMWYDAKS